jgi:hypothetical protein
MKKLLLCFLLLFSAEVFAQENSSEDLTQGVWKAVVEKNLTVSPSQEEVKSFSAKSVTDIYYDHNYQAKDKNDDALLKSILGSKIRLNKNFSVSSVIKLDAADKYDSDFVTNSAGGNVTGKGNGDRFFKNQALQIDEITANYQNKNLTIIAGKFVPDFGINWKWGRGIWSNNLSYDYKQNQKLGGGASLKIGDQKRVGQYNFSFATFTNDNTSLSNSLINKPEAYNKSDAKAGDASGLLQSYNAALDVLFDFGENEKLSYHFSYINLAVNSKATQVQLNKLGDQKGYVAAMNYRYPISENFVVDGLLEYVALKNIGGNSDISDKYSTASLVGEIYRNWNITLATTHLARREVNFNGVDQNLSEISAGYKFTPAKFFDQLLLQVGYKNFRTNYKTSLNSNNSIGALLRLIKSF